MNLFFRLLWFMLIVRWRPAVSILEPCRTPFRVMPTDLDVLRHVNNGVFLSLMDLARVDLITRAGLVSPINARRWYGVVAAETIRFRRSLTLFQRFEIETRVLGWDDKAFVLEQRFIRGDEEVASALVRVRFLARDGKKVTPSEIIALSGLQLAPPVLPADAANWNAAQGS